MSHHQQDQDADMTSLPQDFNLLLASPKLSRALQCTCRQIRTSAGRTAVQMSRLPVKDDIIAS